MLMERHGYAPETVNASIAASELATLIVQGPPALAVGDALQQLLSRAVALLQPASCVRLVQSMWGAAGSLQRMPADAAVALPHSSLRWFPMQDEVLQACRGARLLSPLCLRRVHSPQAAAMMLASGLMDAVLPDLLSLIGTAEDNRTPIPKGPRGVSKVGRCDCTWQKKREKREMYAHGRTCCVGTASLSLKLLAAGVIHACRCLCSCLAPS